MPSFTTQFDKNQIVYFVVYSSAEIVPAVVTAVHLNSPLSNEAVSYTIETDWFEGATRLEYVGESQLFTFSLAKSSLLSWLDTQKARISSMTDPGI